MSKIELPTKTHQNWFVSASTAYFADSGEEFIALGTSNGIIFRVKVGPGQSSFQKEPGFTNGVENSFLCMASCPKSKTLAITTGDGSCLFLLPKESEEWEPVGDSIKEIGASYDWAALSVDILLRGANNLFVVGYSHGMIRLYTSEKPRPLIELQAHSR